MAPFLASPSADSSFSTAIRRSVRRESTCRRVAGGVGGDGCGPREAPVGGCARRRPHGCLAHPAPATSGDHPPAQPAPCGRSLRGRPAFAHLLEVLGLYLHCFIGHAAGGAEQPRAGAWRSARARSVLHTHSGTRCMREGLPRGEQGTRRAEQGPPDERAGRLTGLFIGRNANPVPALFNSS